MLKSEKHFRLLHVCALILLLSSMMFAWQSVSVSYQTDSEQPIYLHSEEPLVPVHMHSTESLVSIHMNSNITLTPIHMNSKEPYQEHIYDPICTYWHEIYPNYCPIWHLTSWEDTGEPYGELSPNDQIDMTDEYGHVSWFHVDRMTVTLELSSYEFPGEIIKVEFKGPLEMPPQEALYYPICTYWHEVWSIYSNVYHLISWYDNNLNGILDFCDDIALNFTRGVIQPGIYNFHVDGVYNDIILRWKMMDPICTWWHEIYPYYCGWHHLTSWEDTGWPEGQLSPSDQIDMYSELTEEDWDIFWSMGDVNRDGYIDDVDIELINRAFDTTPDTGGTPGEWGAWNPDADLNGDDVVDIKDLSICGKNYSLDIWTYFRAGTTWYHIDRVTITLNVTSELYPTEWMKIELKTLFFEEMYEVLKHPIGSLWHEVLPHYSNVYELTRWDWWYDDNCNGVLDACDYIWLLNWAELEPKEERYHIEDICYDIILNKKIMDPRCTTWHELYPNYSNYHHVTSWEEPLEDLYPARLSPCDQIDMENLTDPDGPINWYHVDRVTFTLNLSNLDYPKEIMYIELKEPFEEIYWFKTKPEWSFWHEVWPDYSNVYYISYWEDNCNGVLDYCDVIELEDKDGVSMGRWHVKDLTIDIILNKKIADPVCTQWHELYPEPCREYHLSSWEDNGDGLLSPCDQVDLTLKPDGPTEWYHVENVTLTLLVSKSPDSTMYIEFEGGFEDMYRVKTYPVCTYWHEVYPDFCRLYHLSSWDDDCNWVLSYCDIIDLEPIDPPGPVESWHVEEVAIDITVKKTATPPPGWSGDVRLTTWIQDDFNPAVAVDGKNIHVAWYTVMDPLWDLVRYKRSTDNGATWFSATDIHDGRNPDIAVDGNNIHIVFQCKVFNPNGRYDIWYARSTNNGASWTTVRLTAQDTSDSEYPSIAVSGSNIHVVWEDMKDGHQEVYYIRSTDNGNTWGPETRLSAISGTPSDISERPDIAVSGNNVHVVWSDWRHWNMTWGSELYSKRSTDNGNTWGTDTRLTNRKESCGNPEIAVSGSNVHVVWFETGPPSGIFYVHSTDNGNTWSGVTQLVSNWNGSTFEPEEIAASGNNVHVVWDDEREDPNWDIYYRKSIDNGASWNPIVRLTINESISMTPDVAVFGDNVHVVWQDDRDGNWEIYYKNRLPPVHDVAVIDVTALKTVVSQGYNDTINVTVENQGDFIETFNVTAYANTTVIGTETVTLNSGNNKTLAFTWVTNATTPKGNHLISAKATPVPGETETADNSLTDGTVKVTIPGDINGDGKVDWRDLYTFARAYGSSMGGPAYVPEADFNSDGGIDWQDLLVLARNYGATDP